MQFPFEPHAVHHNHGGRITKITGIGHQIDKPSDGHSRDYWFLTGDVLWSDGRTGTHEIAPCALCYDTDEGKQEIGTLLAALNEYLAEQGDWYHDGKTKHEGWYAHDRKVRRRA